MTRVGCGRPGRRDADGAETITICGDGRSATAARARGVGSDCVASPESGTEASEGLTEPTRFLSHTQTSLINE